MLNILIHFKSTQSNSMSPSQATVDKHSFIFILVGRIKIYVMFSAACELTAKHFEQILERNFQD